MSQLRVLLFVLLPHCVLTTHLRDPASNWPPPTRLRNEPARWSEEWLDGVPVDHFTFTNTDVFRLRFFINETNFEPNGPIFFYTGNEGSLEGFAENTGFMFDIAPEFKAAVVFAEHRFYGQTKPYGNSSYSSVQKLGFLSSEQALADYVLLIDYLKTRRLNNATRSPVIVFGGSYGGMLSAWMRIKYPHAVQGAIAASAPVFWFRGHEDVAQDVYEKIVTRSFVDAGCKAKNVEEGFHAILRLATSQKGRNFLNSLFHLSAKSRIESPDDASFLIAYVKDVFDSMAMVNYPYPTSFLAPLPGWPVKEACRFLSGTPHSDEEFAAGLYQVANLYYNFTGTTKELCANPASCPGAFAALGDPLGWPWQACTEMVMQLCASGPPNDFFIADCPFSVENVRRGCSDTFGKIGYDSSMTRPDWALSLYGASFPTASNIVFSNGYLDPWSGGGWSLVPKTEGTLVSVILKQGAHHYDLRGAHPLDTDEVRKVRELEKTHIRKWIKQAKMA